MDYIVLAVCLVVVLLLQRGVEKSIEAENVVSFLVCVSAWAGGVLVGVLMILSILFRVGR